jgi:hypothetical protein
MQRIETFLKEDEVPDWATSLKRKPTDRKPLPPLPSTSSRPSQLGRGKGKGKDDETMVGFENGIFTWNVITRGRLHTPFKLGPLNLNFPTGELSLISGATGSGKTALLLSLLGGGFSEVSVGSSPERLADLEMACVDGKVFIDKSRGKVAYCAQTPCTLVIILGTEKLTGPQGSNMPRSEIILSSVPALAFLVTGLMKHGTTLFWTRAL